MAEIQIAGVHYDVSEKLAEYITSKFGGLDKYGLEFHHVKVTIHEAAGHGYRIDADLHIAHGPEVVAHDTAETVYAAVDSVVDKCSTQLRRYHDKHAKHHDKHASQS